MDDLCHELAGEASCYIFVDDFHLLTDRRASMFLCMLANRLPVNVHLIVASRDRFLPAGETVRLGSRVYQIGTEQLRLNHTAVSYTHLDVYKRQRPRSPTSYGIRRTGIFRSAGSSRMMMRISAQRRSSCMAR